MNINAQADLKKDSISAEQFIPKLDTSYIQKKSFDSEKLKEFQSSEDFIYEKVEPEPNMLQRFWIWMKESIKTLLRGLFEDIDPTLGVLRSILKAFPYIILAIGLYFIIKYFVNVDPRSIVEGKNESIVQFSSDDELLQREDLEDILSKAIQVQDYRLAIRFSYLIVLKKLRDQGIIKWQQQKTNDDYISELIDKDYKDEFIETTKLYDYVWYGKFEMNEPGFNNAQKTFKKLHQKIV